jgi:WD40 repeat protein
MSSSSLLGSHRRGRHPSAFAKHQFDSPFVPASMTVAMRLEGHRGCINTCSFNPYGDYELTGCDDGCVWLWDIGNRVPTPKLMLEPHRTNVFTTNFLTGSRFISGGNDATVQVIGISNDGTVNATSYRGHHICKVLCSVVIDAHTFATCSYDQTIRLFDIRTPYRLQSSTTLRCLSPAEMTYDGQARLGNDLWRYRLRSQSDGGGPAANPLDIDDSSLLLDFRRRPNSQFYTMDVHPIDRKRFITGGGDGRVRLFDMRMIRAGAVQEREFALSPHDHVTGAAFDLSGDRIAATVLGDNIHVFRVDDVSDWTTDPRRSSPAFRDREMFEHAARARPPGELIELSRHRSRTTIKTVNWFGGFVVSGSDDGKVFFYDPESGDIANIVDEHDGNVNVVTVHQEKKLLATSGIDDYAILWEPRRMAGVDQGKVAVDVRQKLKAAEDFAEYDDGCTGM